MLPLWKKIIVGLEVLKGVEDPSFLQYDTMKTGK
jgi:hypothetical protein